MLPIRLHGADGRLRFSSLQMQRAERIIVCKPVILCWIEDQIATHGPLSSARSEYSKSWGSCFPDTRHIYDEDLKILIRTTAAELQIPLKAGVYMQNPGPNFESPAEVRMCRILGARMRSG